MTTKQKEKAIKKLAIDMLKESSKAMLKQVDKALKSGAVDVDAWSPEYAPMILPKCIVMAIIQDEATQYEARGTSFEKQLKEEVKNIRYYL